MLNADCEKMKESSAQIVIPHEIMFILVLQTRRMDGGGDPFYLTVMLFNACNARKLYIKGTASGMFIICGIA